MENFKHEHLWTQKKKKEIDLTKKKKEKTTDSIKIRCHWYQKYVYPEPPKKRQHWKEYIYS